MERLKKVLIWPKTPIKQALKQMDEAGEKILLVIKKDNYLLGTVTDGDIRRWILKGASLSQSISKAMNINPISLKNGFPREEAKSLMLSNEIECIPIVDTRKRVISAIWWMDLFENRFKEHALINIPVVIMAGGTGTRLSPFTNVLPKPLIPIGEKPIIELIIEKFVEWGCKDFYLSVNYKANILKAYFGDFKHDYNINYIHEGKPLGTIGSLYLLKDIIKSTFFVSNCDILIEADYADILKFHKAKKNKITLIVSMKHYIIPYGICNIKNGGGLRSIKEKPEYDFLVNTGSYLMEAEVLKNIPNNKCYDATDLVNHYIKKGKRVGVYPVSEKSWMDMGQLQGMQDMTKRYVGR